MNKLTNSLVNRQSDYELEDLKNFPTVEQMIKAFSSYFTKAKVLYNTQTQVLYNTQTQEFYYIVTGGSFEHRQFITETYENDLWTLCMYLPPRLITMIGMFYEGLLYSKNNKKDIIYMKEKKL